MSHRKKQPRTLIAVAAVAALVGGEARAAEEPARPNVVLILADDLGYADIGAYGSTVIRTPHIDALAAGGVRFTDAHVSAAVCAPSRAGLLTGRSGNRHGFEFNISGVGELGLDVKEKTFADTLLGAGYRTMGIGKWHLGSSPGKHPLDRGFEHYFGFLAGAQSYIDRSDPQAVTAEGAWGAKAFNERDEVNPIIRDRAMVDETRYLTDAFTEEAVAFIREESEKPFFLYLAYNAPHTPLQATRKYFDRYPEIEDRNARIVAAMVSAVDDGVGAVVAALKEKGIEKDTLVVFLSDNGCPFYRQGYCSNGPFREGKRFHFEGGTRVPFILSWPGTLEPATFDGLTSALDLFTTFAALAGATLPSDHAYDGVDLVPYLTGAGKGAPHTTLVWRAGANYAVRRGAEKLVVMNIAPREALEQVEGVAGGLLSTGASMEVSKLGQLSLLYDLNADLGEEHNLAQSDAATVEALEAIFRDWNAEMVEPFFKTTRGTVNMIDGVPVELIF